MTEPNAEPTPPTGTDLARTDGGDLNARIRYARELATAGDLIPSGLRDGRDPNPGKVLLAIETGNMLGIHPIAALMGIHVIDGKATVSPALMSGVVRKHGHKLRVTVGKDADGPTATATLIRHDDPDYPFSSTWTMARAKAAGLAGKGTWSKYPEAMLKARAIGDVCREGAEDVLLGVHYTPEELGASVNESGEVIEGTVVETLTTPAEPEPDELAVASQALERATAAADVAALVGVWAALPNVVGRYAWAREYRDLKDYAGATLVTFEGEQVSLLDAFGALRKRLEQPVPEPTPAPAYAAPVTAEPVDAEVVPDGEDPWAGGGAGIEAPTVQTHDGAVAHVVTTLGGTVVDEERSGRAAEAQATHEAAIDKARQERERAADQGRTVAPEVGTAKAAAKAAAHAASERARTARQNEAKA